jgi:predicted TIM-barrel fold metal-dependent hydrolase
VIPIIDTDTHLTEVPDLWTSKLPLDVWGEDVPHVIYDERKGVERWVVGGRKITGVAGFASSRWHEYPPSFPPTLAEADPAAYDAALRVRRMDESGITSEVVFPNLYGFQIHAFLGMKDPQLRFECIRVYNDHIAEMAAHHPGRFILLAALPFWDVEESVREIQRCHAMGFKGIMFPSKPYKLDLPPLEDPHWRPLFEVAQELRLPVNFHIGFQQFSEEELRAFLGRKQTRWNYARESAMTMMGLSEALGDVVASPVCHQYPDLKFVLVESGFGWIPYFLDALDWQWINTGAMKEYPERELPSYYFRNNVMCAFWFERQTVKAMAHLYPDNIMFESDFPHSTSLSPGPASSSGTPREMAEIAVRELPDDLARKILYGNAARLFGLDGAS